MDKKSERREPETLRFRSSDGIPNHPAWPALIYRCVWADGENLPEAIEETFHENGWGGCWRWGVFDYHHFHSNAHEALGVARGEAVLRLGGPDGQTVRVSAGDLVVLPAGTGHKKESSSSGFLVVGAYPQGQDDYDLCREDSGKLEDVKKKISRVPLPSADPAYGPSGPLLRLWT